MSHLITDTTYDAMYKFLYEAAAVKVAAGLNAEFEGSYNFEPSKIMDYIMLPIASTKKPSPARTNQAKPGEVPCEVILGQHSKRAHQPCGVKAVEVYNDKNMCALHLKNAKTADLLAKAETEEAVPVKSPPKTLPKVSPPKKITPVVLPVKPAPPVDKEEQAPEPSPAEEVPASSSSSSEPPTASPTKISTARIPIKKAGTPGSYLPGKK